MTVYLTLEALLAKVDDPNRTGCLKLLKNNEALFRDTYGSVHNHQTWKGGYYDHIVDAINIGVQIYLALEKTNRELPFTLSDVILIIFLHDIEKPWKYQYNEDGEREIIPELISKEAQHVFRASKLAEYGIFLNNMQRNAMLYAEGENSAYSPNERVMKELGAVVHCADILSARVFYNYPMESNDPWIGAKRVNTTR